MCLLRPVARLGCYICGVRHGLLVLALTLFAAGGVASSATQEVAPTSKLEQAAIDALQDGRMVRARTLSEQAIASDPRSALAHYVLGVAMKEGDGNLPLSLRELQKARELIELGRGIARPGMEKWHREILLELAYALSDMGHYEALLDVHAEIRRLYVPTLHGSDVWPLMKLGRIDEARAAAARAIASGDAFQEHVARNGLCALDGYPACQAMLSAVRDHDLPSGLALRNTGVSAIEAGRLEEAERLLIESTENPDEDTNPFRDLLTLYTEQNRLAEAIDAARQMVLFARSVSRRQRQYSRGGELAASGALLLVAGHPSRALAASARALTEPDRAAHWSGSSSELSAEVALLDRAARLTLAEQFAEASAILSWYQAPRLTTRRMGLQLGAWFSARNITPLLLQGGLRPREGAADRERPQLSGPQWLFPDAIELFGASPTLALVESVRRSPPSDDSPIPRELRRADLDAQESEARFLLGDYDGCIRAGELAREQLPPSLRLLRTRLAARMAAAAYKLQRGAEAWALYAEVMSADPGTLRRLRQPLPVKATPTAGLLGNASRLVLATPRFVEDERSPFRLAAAGSSLCLFAPGDVTIACASDPGLAATKGAVQPEVSAAGEASAFPTPPSAREAAKPEQRIALALLDVSFAPRINLTQSDLGTLDGSPVAEQGLSREDADSVLDLPR